MLPSGTTISHYQLDCLIGAGGMGEVYRAVDSNLGRAVALKILSESIVNDSEHLRRFLREAKTASALNHPNIVTIHEVGREPAVLPDGLTAGVVQFIAMELVEGLTLRTAMAEGRDRAELLSILSQAAEGLARAHEEGIVHRDLKPENLMISRDGYCKVVDFGLAKSIRPLALSPDASTVETIRTAEGVLVGTIGYMSPEQVRGKPLDARSDIFSFGCVLYELATGRQPFRSETAIDTLHKIAYAEAPPIAGINPSTPPELVSLIGICLAKNPDARYSSMKEVAAGLRRVSSGGRSTTAGTPPLPRRPRHALRWAMTMSVLIAAAGATWIAVANRETTPLASKASAPARPSYVTRFAQAKFRRITNEGNVTEAVISPDGRYLLYSVNETPNELPPRHSFWLRQVGAPGAMRLLDTDRISSPRFSPDGAYVYFTITGADRGGIYRIGVLGGVPRKVADSRGPVTFSPDGTRIAYIRDRSVWANDLDGSSEKRLTPVDALPELSANPVWSPDGRSIAFTSVDMSPGKFEVTPHVIATRTAVVTALDHGAGSFVTSMSWTPDSSSLLVTTDGVWSVPLSGAPARQIIEESDDRYSSLSLNRSGDVAVAVQSVQLSGIWKAPRGDFSRASELTRRSFGGDGTGGLAVSRDGEIVYTSAESGKTELWSMRGDGSMRHQLTWVGRSGEMAPRVSATGDMIAFSGPVEDVGTVWVLDRKTNVSRRLLDVGGSRPLKVSIDGKAIYATIPQGDTKQVARVPLTGGVPVVVHQGDFILAEISNDERYALIVRDVEKGPFSVAADVIRLADASVVDSFITTIEIARTARWSPDDKGIDYIDTKRDVSNLWRHTIGGRSRQLTSFRDQHISAFAWTHEGALLCARTSSSSDVVMSRDF